MHLPLVAPSRLAGTALPPLTSSCSSAFALIAKITGLPSIESVVIVGNAL